ncbi:MAG: hypothetical protein QMC53_02045, partial [Candidatus Poseidoniaceae archaeon]
VPNSTLFYEQKRLIPNVCYILAMALTSTKRHTLHAWVSQGFYQNPQDIMKEYCVLQSAITMPTVVYIVSNHTCIQLE